MYRIVLKFCHVACLMANTKSTVFQTVEPFNFFQMISADNDNDQILQNTTESCHTETDKNYGTFVAGNRPVK